MTDMRNPSEPIAAGTTGWATETLKEYVDSRFEALKELMASQFAASDRRYEQRFVDSQRAVDAALNAARTAVEAALTSAKEAVTKAETAAEKRFEGVNEFRATLADQQRTLLPRVEGELRFVGVEARITKLESAQVESTSKRTGGKELWAIIIAVLGAAALIYGLTR